MLSQEPYVEKLLEKFNMSESKTLETPLDVSLKLSEINSPEIGSNEHREMHASDYRDIVGCLNYLALTSRPDIAHAAKLLRSFVENPGRRQNPGVKMFKNSRKVKRNSGISQRYTVNNLPRIQPS